MTIRKVGVLGCGLMGAGIAEVAAKSGCDVVVREVSRELLDKGMGRLRGSLDRAVEKGKLEAVARDATLARLAGTTEVADHEATRLHSDEPMPLIRRNSKGFVLHSARHVEAHRSLIDPPRHSLSREGSDDSARRVVVSDPQRRRDQLADD